MTRKQAARKRFLAGVLSMALVSAGTVMVIDAATTPDPAIHVEGLELKIKTDPSGKQSVQALVEISLTNVIDRVDPPKTSGRNQVTTTRGFCRGAVMTLDYNPDYLEPSDWVTNEGYGAEGIRADGRVYADEKGTTAPVTDPIDYSDPLHHLFFHTDSSLYNGTYSDGVTPMDPLKFWKESNNNVPSPSNVPTELRGEALTVDANKNRVHFDLQIRDFADMPMGTGGGQVKSTQAISSTDKQDYYYFEMQKTTGKPGVDNRLILGTLSFRVNEKFVEASGTVEDLERKLQEMVSNFDGLDWTYDMDKTTDPSAGKPYLFRESKAGANEEPFKRDMKHLVETVTTRIGNPNPISKTYTTETNEYAIGIHISIDADDVIQDVWPVKDDITINSYQAYTNGNIGDIATAMQNYAEAIRVKHVSGKLNDLTIHWGESATTSNMPADGPGMFIQKAVPDGTGGWMADPSTPRYRFKWSGSGYTIEEEGASGFTPTTSAAIYGVGGLFDPRGDFAGDGQHGHYIIQQYFTYWENSHSGGTSTVIRKAFPRPVTVTLHVTPIKVIDATVEKQQLTYRNVIDDVPQAFGRLDLADDAKLILDTTINGLTPAMPVSWTPTLKTPAWTVGTLDDSVLGIPGAGNPNASIIPPSDAKWPIGEPAVLAKEGIGTYTFDTIVLQTDIQTKYPWVTVDRDYPLNSTRRIVDVAPPVNPGDPEPQLPRYVMWAEPYEVRPAGAPTSVTAGDPVARLRITIARQEATWNATTEQWVWNFVNMNAGYQFKLYMPNDQQIRADASENWFGASSSAYTPSYQTGYTDAGKGITNQNVYQFTISPGDLGASDTYAAQREVLRQYINLGGWFSADVLEPGATDWNDRISGFSQPRNNIYTMSYILDPAAVPTPVPTGTETWLFNYTGDRAGLMPFYSDSDLPTFITLPADETVEVRYDAVTGSQPGQMRQFKVEGTVPPLSSPAVERWNNVMGDKWTPGDPVPDKPTWATPKPAASPNPAVPGEVVTYGADRFERSYDYSNFGTVKNADFDAVNIYPTDLQDRQATIKVEVQDPQATPSTSPVWELKLTYEQTGDNVTQYFDGAINEVERVTFDNKMEGFTYQQIVTLTLTNTGNRDIRGLHIEIPDAATGSGGKVPCFRLVTPPPTSLAVGASATFQLSYVQNLPEDTYQDIFTTEPIHIWHDNSGPSADGTAPVTLPGHTAEGFEAVLKVTKTRPHKVTVVIHPSVDDTGAVTKPMGDGWLVQGVTTTGGVDKYDNALGVNVYEQKERFWVLTQPEDEYALITTNISGTARTWVYYVRDDDPTKTPVYLNEYQAAGGNSGFGTVDDSFVTQDNPQRLFWGDMPDCSVTVHVHYYEPLLSKLRLGDLHAYAWDGWSDVTLKTPSEPAAWVEKAGVSSVPDPTDPDSYLNRSDAFERPLNIHKAPGNNYEQILFQPDKDEYIVFLDPSSMGTDNLCGVSISLRKLVTHINGVGDDASPVQQNNVDIYPNVLMTLDDASNTKVCNDIPDPTATPPTTPSTAGPTYHHSTPFSAPVDDPTQTSIAQTTVTITISYDGTALVPPEGLESRTYKVRFVRRMEDGKAKHIAKAGNSPYGMIENDADITDKATAQQVFDARNRFDFDPANAAYLPTQATGLTNIYWPEAWGDGVNYDKDLTALFVYAGEPFYDPGVEKIYNNAGDYIDDIMVNRSLTYVKLDTTQTTPWDRFNVDPSVAANTDTINFGDVPAVNGTIPGETITLTTGGTSTSYNGLINGLTNVPDIRPGIYELKYTYKDHDKTTDLSFTRPLIVLSPNGDVDANWVQRILSGGNPNHRVMTGDKTAIQQRFTTALPYELPTMTYSAADALVYKYRIVDANNDRNINNIDAGLVRKVTTLTLTHQLTEFYRPTQYTDPIKP